MDALYITVLSIVAFLVFCMIVDKTFGGSYGKEKGWEEETPVLTGNETDTREGLMAKITDVNRAVLRLEGGKAEVNVAQGMDYIHKLNLVLGGELYKLIRKMPKTLIAENTRKALK